jgi:hypothetical protein
VSCQTESVEARFRASQSGRFGIRRAVEMPRSDRAKLLAHGGERESFLTIDLIPEATWYVASRIAVFTGLGASYVIASKDIPEGGATASGASVGAILAFGADFSFNPDWNARATLADRQGLTDADLTSDSGVLVARGGSSSSLQLALSAGYNF